MCLACPQCLRMGLNHRRCRRAALFLSLTAGGCCRLGKLANGLVRGKASIYHVGQMLGHESLDTLKHYVKLHIADLKETHHRTHPREKDEEERENN